MDHQQQPSSATVRRVRNPWSPEEDAQLRYMVQIVGPRCWSNIAKSIPGRTAKSCRLRWWNQLSPTVVHRPFTPQEDATIIYAQQKHGNKWATIARLLNGRSDNAVKNRWNATLKKKHSGHNDLGRNDTVPGGNATRAASQVTNEQVYTLMTDEISRMMQGGSIPTELSLFGSREEREGGELPMTATVAKPTPAGGIEFTDFMRELVRQEMMGLLRGDGRPSFNITSHGINEGLIRRFI